jgi:two-component system sensor histidine kinase KdpD
VVIDPARIGQAILNLVENAVKYSPPSATVTFEFYRRDPFGGLRLINQGPPLTPGSEEKIFQRFFRENEGSPGFGLGLSIARAAVELHGGTLRTFSPAAGGAGFQLELPLRQEPGPHRSLGR